MTAKTQDRIVQIILSKILTPVIYMLEDEDILSFICFCDRDITMQEIYDVESMIKHETGCAAEIVDIREFSEAERIDVISEAVLIYSENSVIETIFTQSMAEDYSIAMGLRNIIIDRVKETGTVYLQ